MQFLLSNPRNCKELLIKVRIFPHQDMFYQHFDVYFHLYVSFGESNGTPLQYSCLENPMDRGAWWAAVSGVTHTQKFQHLEQSPSHNWYTMCVRMCEDVCVHM